MLKVFRNKTSYETKINNFRRGKESKGSLTIPNLFQTDESYDSTICLTVNVNQINDNSYYIGKVLSCSS